ncbi:hypothetical protein [Streptomyces sp. NPDC101776]|uniref:hypothetical protein n=1 Tax=Streptomyces sp. NPDC101776 TaxID=3366146 RepID=UPI0038304BEC
MPALTPDALRAATSAQRAQSFAPLRTFVHMWGVFVAVQRYCSRAVRLRHLEDVVSGGVEDPADAITCQFGKSKAS